jgi:hypothetical protein
LTVEPKLPRTVYYILASWGAAVLLLAGLFAFWIDRNNDTARERDQQIQTQQTRYMCQIVGVIVSGPAPPAGPEGERGRVVVAGARGFYDTARCAELLAHPGP